MAITILKKSFSETTWKEIDFIIGHYSKGFVFIFIELF